VVEGEDRRVKTRSLGRQQYLSADLDVLLNKEPSHDHYLASLRPSGSLVLIQGLFLASRPLSVCSLVSIQGTLLTSNTICPIMDPVPQVFAKRAATSPLISEFDKKSKLGLTDEESEKLNATQKYMDFPNCKNPQDVKHNSLVFAFQTVGSKVSIMKEWEDVHRCAQYIGGLSRQEQLDLATLWIDARDTQNWTRFANYRALRPFHRRTTVSTVLYSYKSGPIHT
jgi:hypothetical protein